MGNSSKHWWEMKEFLFFILWPHLKHKATNLCSFSQSLALLPFFFFPSSFWWRENPQLAFFKKANILNSITHLSFHHSHPSKPSSWMKPSICFLQPWTRSGGWVTQRGKVYVKKFTTAASVGTSIIIRNPLLFLCSSSIVNESFSDSPCSSNLWSLPFLPILKEDPVW